jgi:type IV secretory pathway TrbF-like protein
LTHNRTASFIPSIEASADTFMLSWNEVVLDRRGELTSDARSEIAVVVVPER